MTLDILKSLDPQQYRAATDAARKILVSAGAGSGKTRVLTARYLHLMAENAKLTVDNILTLTFTRKAAQEMRERIARELMKEGREAERRALGRAPIGTIHSFCERVLREHALQAGIDPHFRLLDDALAITLQEKVLDEVLETAWTDHESRQEISRLLLDMPHETLRSALLGTYRTGRTHGHDAAGMTPVACADIPSAVVAVKTAVEELLASTGTPAWTAALARARDAYEVDLLPLLEAPWDANRFWERYYHAAELLKCLTPAGGPKGIAKALRDAVKDACGHWLQAQLDGAALPYLHAMKLLIGRFDLTYQAAKEAEGLLDYEDLLLRTRALLQDDESGVARRFQGRFAHVMVDEFQDTNPLQFAIVSALCGPEGCLFAVGDVKQSIYRFIGSDVRVFLAYEERLIRENEALLALQTNYRSRPDVLQPINGLFAARWPVHPARRDDGFTFQPLLSPDVALVEKATPSMEIAFWTESEEGADTLRTREADWIARRILQLTGRTDAPALPVDAPESDERKNANFGDIIVLFRTSTEIPLYAQRLRAAGVPVYVVSGRGFYQAREVQDIIHLLRVLENPLDDFSLTVVLRSLLVAVSDDALYWLSHAARLIADEEEGEDTDPKPAPPRHCGRMWEAIERQERIPRLEEVDRRKLIVFRTVLTELHGMVAAGQPLDLLDVILARTGYATCLLAGEDGEQRYANVQKLREVASSFQQWGLFDLADFRRHLAQLQEVAPREASAPLDAEKSQSVRLMTIHAAKGLEAPVVFLADCGWGRVYASRAHDRFLYQPEIGMACQVPTPEGDHADPAGFLALRARIEEADAREAERLLYVALTRAREHLICAGYRKANIMPPTYMGLLSEMLQASCEPGEGGIHTMTVGDVVYQVRVWTEDELDAVAQLPAQAARVTTVWEAYAAQIRAGSALPIAAGEEDFQSVVTRFVPLEPARRDLPLRVGVNRALCYDACPRQYWFRHLLHREQATRGALPPVLEVEDDGQDDTHERTDGTAFGLLLHDMMQRVDFAHPLLEQLPELLPVISQETSRSITSGEERDLRACLTRLTAMKAYREMVGATTLHRELRFLAREGNVLFPGIIDVLAEDAAGWWVLDYKTGRFSPRHLQQVGLYALGLKAAMGIEVGQVRVIYLDEHDPAKAMQERRMTPDFADALRAMLRRVGEGIRHGQFAPAPGRQCEYCAFLPECPTGRETVENGTQL